MYTHFSLPTGCRSTNHLISFGFCFNEWKWFSALKKKVQRGFMGYLNNGSTVLFILFLGAQTEIKKPCEVLRFPRPNGGTGSDGFVTCLEDLWTSLLPFDRTKHKRQMSCCKSHSRCPCVAISGSFLQQRVAGNSLNSQHPLCEEKEKAWKLLHWPSFHSSPPP